MTTLRNTFCLVELGVEPGGLESPARAGGPEWAIRGESGECNGHVRGTTASQVIFVGEFSPVELGDSNSRPCLPTR